METESFKVSDITKDKHKKDDEMVESLKDLIDHPLDIPSIERQLWYGIDEPFLSDGYTWTDKPSRLVDKAIREIRFLREELIKIKRYGK